MSFLNPLLLAGVGAISVPVLIHLLNRSRVRRVAWAAMRFLHISVERNQRRMNVEDWLLLALRCLLLALLALALARPTFQNAAAVLRGRTAVTGVVILDNSYSMGMTDGVQSRFARAKKFSETIIDAMPGNSATAIWLASDVVRGLVLEPTRDLNLARKTLREATLSDRSTRLFPAVRDAVEALRRRGSSRKEIYLLTDGQAGGWEELSETIKLLNEVKRDIHLNLILISDREEHNLGVSDLRLGSSLTPVDQSLRFEVQVTNFGHDDARGVAVRLAVDNDPPSDQTVLDIIPAGAAKNVSLFTKLRTEGYHAVTAEITGDRLAADDRRTLVVAATRRLRVLLVDGHPSRDALENETFYLRNALLPVDSTAVNDFYIEPVVITPTELAGTRVDNFPVVVLANVSDFSQATATALDQYVRRGGGLIVFPGNLVNARFYNEELANRYGLLPATLGPLMEAADDEHAFHLQAKAYDHPLVTLWNDPAAISKSVPAATDWPERSARSHPVCRQRRGNRRAHRRPRPGGDVREYGKFGVDRLTGATGICAVASPDARCIAGATKQSSQHCRRRPVYIADFRRDARQRRAHHAWRKITAVPAHRISREPAGFAIGGN